LDDSKRHTLDLEDKVRQLKIQLEETNNKPTKDTAQPNEGFTDEHVAELE